MSTLAPTSPVLTVSSLTSGTLSNADGFKLLLALKEALSEQSGTVTLDLTGVISFSSSFLNSSLGALFEELGVNSFKRLRLSNCKPAQVKMIKEYMADVAQTHQAY
jgi:anti-anti-sigma regulatory factor